MRHPSEAELALYAGGDASLWVRARVSRHVRWCAACAGLVREFRAAREWMRGQDELPPEVNWMQLAAVMKANIRVGLAAGQCIERAPKAAGWRLWRPALVVPVLLVMIAGWWLQSLAPPAIPLARRPVAEELVVRAHPGSIELEQAGRALALLHPRDAQVTISASGGSLRARYVDAETGFVTIGHVYTQ